MVSDIADKLLTSHCNIIMDESSRGTSNWLSSSVHDHQNVSNELYQDRERRHREEMVKVFERALDFPL